MADAGHIYPTRSTMVRQAFTDLQTRFEAIVATDAVDQEALVALQREEVDLAVADVDCADGFDELQAEVAQAYESDFIAENRETLEAIRDGRGDG
jgi:hypothetical protein